MKPLVFLLLLTSQLVSGYHPAIDYIFPLPDSELLTPKTTIILKLGSAYNDKVTNLSTLIRVSGDEGNVEGSVFWAADDRTIIFKPAQDLNADQFYDVRIQTSQVTTRDFAYTFKTAARGVNDFDGLQKHTNASDRNTNVGSVPPVRLINGVAVPSDFPNLRTQQFGETAPGKIFYATNYPQEGTGNYLIICENDGTPYFYRRYDDVVRSGNLTVHPTGDLTAHFYFKWFYVVLDEHFVEVDTIRVGHGYETDNHELQILKNGHSLLIARDRAKIDMSRIVSGGQGEATVEGHHLQELDADRNVIFEWRSWDHYYIRDSFVNLKGGFIDYVHMNSIAIDYDGHYVISARDLNEITKINRTTGEIIWRLNGRNNEFTFLNDPDEFIYQHDFRPLPGKPNYYTVFDNGRGRHPQHSRAVEYKIDPQQKTIEKVWEYRHQPDWYSSSMGSAQRLPNGNTLVDFPAGETRAVEVNRAGDVLFELISQGHSNYRCRRFEWSGKMQQPYLVTEDLGTTVRLIFNKFGDADVKQYNIYYGTRHNPTQRLATTSQTYYDATQLEPKVLYYFRVTAVDGQNNESDYSNEETGTIRVLAPGQNAVRNGSFDSDEFWDFHTTSGQAVSRISDGQYKIIVHTNSDMAEVRLTQSDIIVLQNKSYVFEFDAYASSPRAINAKVESATSPHINYGKIGNTAITTRLKHYRFPFEMQHPTDTEARVIFHCGGEPGDIYIDNVSLTYSEPASGDSVVKINFQPPDVDEPSDYLVDIGLAYANRESGLNYGWLDGDNDETRVREGQSDLRYATLNHMQKDDIPRIWELKVPNGTYEVFLVMGDAGYTDQLNFVRLENLVLSDPDGEDYFDEYSASVRVDDGRLTIQPTSQSSNAKLCFIEISGLTLNVELPESTEQIPQHSELFPNFPNPFNSSTTIRFDLAQEEFVNLSVFDIRGRLVTTLVSQTKRSGRHAISFDASDLASGLFFYKLETPSVSLVQKMLVVK